eukprot:scaffold253221_cov53-Attheya_sp.AAC.1
MPTFICSWSGEEGATVTGVPGVVAEAVVTAADEERERAGTAGDDVAIVADAEGTGVAAASIRPPVTMRATMCATTRESGEERAPGTAGEEVAAADVESTQNAVIRSAPVVPSRKSATKSASRARGKKLARAQSDKTSRPLPPMGGESRTLPLDPIPKRIRRERGFDNFTAAESEGWNMLCPCPVDACRSVKMSLLVKRAKERDVTFRFTMMEDGRIDFSAAHFSPLALQANSIEVAKLRRSLRDHFTNELYLGQPLCLEHKLNIPQMFLDGIENGVLEYKVLGAVLNASDDAV